MLQKLALAAVGLILAGCVSIADPATFGAPRTDQEKADVEAGIRTSSSIGLKLYEANSDLCSGSCRLDIFVGVANGIGAWSGPDGVSLSTDLLRFLQNNDELAVTLGHEWAHILLRHSGGRTIENELAADCVGALIAQRAGFDAKLGALSLTRIGQKQTATTLLLLPFGMLYLPGDIDPGIRYQNIVKAVDRASPISRNTVGPACGVRL